MRGSLKEESELTPVSLPTTLHRRIQERIEGTGFESVDEYAAYVLHQVLAEEDVNLDLCDAEDVSVRKRLSGLGYV